MSLLNYRPRFPNDRAFSWTEECQWPWYVLVHIIATSRCQSINYVLSFVRSVSNSDLNLFAEYRSGWKIILATRLFDGLLSDALVSLVHVFVWISCAERNTNRELIFTLDSSQLRPNSWCRLRLNGSWCSQKKSDVYGFYVIYFIVVIIVGNLLGLGTVIL